MGHCTKGFKGAFDGCENVLYFNWAGSYMACKLSKPNTLYTWKLCILLYIYCISVGGFSNNVLRWLKATQGVRRRTDTGALVVWLSARPIGLHNPPSSSFLFLDALFSTKSGWWLVLMTIWNSMTKNWEVFNGPTVKSGTLNYQLRTTLETAMTHTNFKQDKIMIISPLRRRWVENEWAKEY